MEEDPLLPDGETDPPVSGETDPPVSDEKEDLIDPTLCKGYTNRNRKCRNKANGSDFCSVHDPSNRCSVCLEKFSKKTVRTLGCHHKFHIACIEQWEKISSHCPICRVYIDTTQERKLQREEDQKQSREEKDREQEEEDREFAQRLSEEEAYNHYLGVYYMNIIHLLSSMN
jgi:hypothetical protein